MTWKSNKRPTLDAKTLAYVKQAVANGVTQQQHIDEFLRRRAAADLAYAHALTATGIYFVEKLECALYVCEDVCIYVSFVYFGQLWRKL